VAAARSSAGVLLEGHRSVEAALVGGSRQVHEILSADPADRGLARLRRLAAERDVPLRFVPRPEIDALANGHSHGGLVARAGARRYLALGQLLAAAGPAPLVVLLDGVEDPYNFGQAIRALYAAGVDGLLVRSRAWDGAAAVVARASAGASELMPTATVDSADEAADRCQAAGLQVVCADAGPRARPLQELDLTPATLLVIGGERRGITRSFLARADLRVRVPYGRAGAASLGTATAAAVIAFEALRQRSAKH